MPPPSPFRLLHSLPTPPSPSLPPRTLFILDSSFNPPTRAHLHLALSALRAPPALYPRPHRLLLLLSTTNADKASAPASLDDRVAMMRILARELRETLAADHQGGAAAAPAVDVGLTTHPYFHLKSRAIADSGVYAADTQPPTQVFLLGFDTLTRLLDPVYYPPAHTLAPVSALLTRHRLRVHLRPGPWGEAAAQRAWVRDSFRAGGEVEARGGRGEWAGRIEIVDAAGGEGVSSSAVRRAVAAGGTAEGVVEEGLVTPGIGGFIAEKGLYRG